MQTILDRAVYIDVSTEDGSEEFKMELAEILNYINEREFAAIITKYAKKDRVTKDDLNKMESELAAVANKLGDVSEPVQLFFQWFIKTKSGGDDEEEIELDCKPPLPPGSITFNEIAGQLDVKADIEKNYIYPFKYPRLFPTKSKGLMLYGPPGTGKTLIARAATAELEDVAFFAPTPGDLKGKYEGETEKQISNTFKCASLKLKNSSYHSSIIFIDEFDSLAGQRGDDQSMRRSVNALLQAMDGIKETKGVSVIAATNYPWDIDEAILRRFSARIFIDLPDQDAREWLIRSALVKAYSLPGEDTSAITRDLIEQYSEGRVSKWNDEIFENIEMYGGKRCSSVVTGLFGRTEKNDLINAEIVRSIADQLGPNAKGKKIIDTIKSGTRVDPSEMDPDATFGYSASDITKMMDIAIQIAAYEALYGFFVERKIGDKRYYVSVSRIDIDIQGYGKVYAMIRDAIEDVDDINFDVVMMDDEQKRRALNFSLCGSQIDEAIREYPSTIKGSAYVNLLNYKYLGVFPE